MTKEVETCRPDKFTIVYILNVVLMTDVFLYFNTSGWKTSNSCITLMNVCDNHMRIDIGLSEF
jgi:hypothetical protein